MIHRCIEADRNKMKTTYYMLSPNYPKSGYGLRDGKEPEFVYIGDKLNLNIDIWVSPTPANIVYGHTRNGTLYEEFPYLCKSVKIHCENWNDPINSIREYIRSNPKNVYFSGVLIEEDVGATLIIRMWRSEMLKDQFDELKLHPKNSKNIYKL